MTKQNVSPNEPELIDVLNLLRKDVMLGLSSHHVGSIESFDAEKQTARVTVAYKKTFYEPNPVTGVFDETYKEYPILIDCPVIVLSGGKGSLRFPITAGDDCLMLFNDRDIDNWFSGNYDAAPKSLRLHSLSDGFALVGLHNTTKPLKLYAVDKTELWHGEKSRLSLSDALVAYEFLKDDSTLIGFKADAASSMLNYGVTGFVGAKDKKIVLKSDTLNLKTELQELCTQLNNLNTQLGNMVAAIKLITVPYASPGGPAVSGPPGNAASFDPINTAITTTITNAINDIKTNIGTLIE